MQISVACNLIPLGDRLDSDPTVDFLDKDAVGLNGLGNGRVPPPRLAADPRRLAAVCQDTGQSTQRQVVVDTWYF